MEFPNYTKKDLIFIKSLSCGGRIWTNNLRVMSPTSYRVALPRDILLRLICSISRKLLYRDYRVLSTVFYNFFDIFLKVILINPFLTFLLSFCFKINIVLLNSSDVFNMYLFCRKCNTGILSKLLSTFLYILTFWHSL